MQPALAVPAGQAVECKLYSCDIFCTWAFTSFCGSTIAISPYLLPSSKLTSCSRGRWRVEAVRGSAGSWTQSAGSPSACCPPGTQSAHLLQRSAVCRSRCSADAASCLGSQQGDRKGGPDDSQGLTKPKDVNCDSVYIAHTHEHTHS